MNRCALSTHRLRGSSSSLGGGSKRGASAIAHAAGKARIDVALLDFIQFAIARKIEFASVRPAVGADGVRGIFATAPVEPKDTLISVPRTAALVVAPGERSPTLPAAATAAGTRAGRLPDAAWAALPWFGQLAVKLAAEAAAGPASAMHDFVRALPQQPVDLPAMWTSEDVAMLHYPFLEAKVRAIGWNVSMCTCVLVLTVNLFNGTGRVRPPVGGGHS